MVASVHGRRPSWTGGAWNTTRRARGLNFGLDVPVSGDYADPRLLASLASDAEQAGWDGVFVQEVLSLPEPAVDPWIALAAIALCTERIRIGCFMTPLARRRPWQVARQAATIDRLSGGRLTFGAGLGYAEDDFTPFGEEWDPVIRAQKLDEALDVLVGLWRGTPFSYAGTHHRIGRALLRPSPSQQPRPPIWVAAGWPRRAPLRRASRWDGVYLMTVHQETGDMLRPSDIEEVAAHLAGLGRDKDHALEIAFNVRASGDQATDIELAKRFEEAGGSWWVELDIDDVGPDGYRARIRRGPPGTG